jgi:hypothetical protein
MWTEAEGEGERGSGGKVRVEGEIERVLHAQSVTGPISALNCLVYRNKKECPKKFSMA